MKRFLAWLMGMMMVLAALSPAAAAETQGAIRITLLHTNDSHGRIEEGDGMGFAKIAALVRQYREDNPHTLLLDAGDTFHGTTFATLVRGESVAEVMNAVGYDAMTAGNHDFNYGYERLLELKEVVDFPVISANVKTAAGTRLLEPYIIREAGGIKLGIFGLATPETTYKTHPNNVADLTFVDPVEEAKVIVAELKDQVDAIIALTHLGIDASSTDTSIRLAREVPGIDLIVDGHSHSTLVEGLPGEHDTLIVSAGEYTKYLGVVELVFDAGKKLVSKQAKLIGKEDAAAVDPDPAVAEVIAAVKAAQETVLAEKIGSTAVRLDGEREQVRAGETNLGNLITDAMLDLTRADAAITNGGGIRASIEAGEITKGDVITVLPFGNYIVTKRISGADLKAALENGIDAYPEPKGAFPHVAGMTYRIDVTKPAGQRAIDIRIKGEPLDPDRSYLIATNDFMAAGGDEYTMLADAPIVNEYPALDEALIAYIQKRGEVAPKKEGRIAEAGGAQPDGEGRADGEKSPQAGEETVYIVKKGDTLWAIGLRHNTTWQELARRNNLANPHLIFPGQRIVIGN